MSTLKTGALRGTSGTADSVQLHASDQSVTFPGAVTVTGALNGSGANLTGITTGKILQAQETYDQSGRNTASNFPQASGIKRTITPSSASSKILVMATCGVFLDGGSATNRIGLFALRNNTTPKTLYVQRVGCSLGNSGNVFIPATLMRIDEPNSTSEQEYEITYGSYDSYSDATVKFADGWDATIDSVSMANGTTLICLEIGA